MPPLSPTRRWLALLALALGGFGIGATEFVAMGLLPDLARDLLPGLAAADPEQAIAALGLADQRLRRSASSSGPRSSRRSR